MAYEPTETLPPAMRAIVLRELAPGETITWARQPIARAPTTRTVVMLLIGIGCLATCVALLLEGFGPGAEPAREGAKLAIAAAAAGLAAFGLIGFVMPLLDRRERRRTAYVVTDRRAIVLRWLGGGRVSARSFSARRVETLERIEYGDGSGDLVLDTLITYGPKRREIQTPLGFLGIADVREVEAVLRRTLVSEDVAAVE